MPRAARANTQRAMKPTLNPPCPPKKQSKSKAKQDQNPWYNRSTEYVQNNDIVFPEEEFVVTSFEEGTLFEREAGSRREHSMNLHGNMKHILEVTHLPTNTSFLYCYIARIVLVKRVMGKLKKSVPAGFKVNKLTSSKIDEYPAFAPFLKYLPDFITNDPKAKNAKETFSSRFAVFCKGSTTKAKTKAASRSSSSSSSAPPTSPESTPSQLSPGAFDLSEESEESSQEENIITLGEQSTDPMEEDTELEVEIPEQQQQEPLEKHAIPMAIMDEPEPFHFDLSMDPVGYSFSQGVLKGLEDPFLSS